MQHVLAESDDALQFLERGRDENDRDTYYECIQHFSPEESYLLTCSLALMSRTMKALRLAKLTGEKQPPPIGIITNDHVAAVRAVSKVFNLRLGAFVVAGPQIESVRSPSMSSAAATPGSDS